MCHEFSQPPARQRACESNTALRCRTGQTLFEISVMVTVLMALAGALLPVVGESIANSRIGRARNDAAQIATALANFQRDVGRLRFRDAGLRSSTLSSPESRVVELLVSRGALPALANDVPASSSADRLLPGVLGRRSMQPWTTIAGADALDAHLRFNDHRYSAASAGSATGWHGPYLGRAVDADPWGHAYLVNVKFLASTPSTPDGWSAEAVFVLSAGPNGIVETPFAQPVGSAHAYGDDVVVRIQ